MLTHNKYEFKLVVDFTNITASSYNDSRFPLFSILNSGGIGAHSAFAGAIISGGSSKYSA